MTQFMTRISVDHGNIDSSFLASATIIVISTAEKSWQPNEQCCLTSAGLVVWTELIGSTHAWKKGEPFIPKDLVVVRWTVSGGTQKKY